MAKIVFAEDDPTVRKLVRVALRSLPHELYLAEDGVEALELIERELPDVVFSDISMPRMDGIQLVDAIKGRPHLAHIPVIFVTASVQRYQLEEAYSHGIADYVRKPFDLKDLWAKVEEFVGSSERKGELEHESDGTGGR